MIHVNKVILLGTVGHVESRTLDNGSEMLRMRVVTRQYYQRDKQTYERNEWHNVVLWGNLAATIARIVNKGDHIYVEGQIRYLQSENGKNLTSIVARAVSVFSKKQALPTQPEQAVETRAPLEEDIPVDEDLPF